MGSRIEKALAAVFCIAVMSGCAPMVSKRALDEADKTVTAADVQRAPDNFKGRRVVWGGQILSVENLEKTTVIEVFQTKLDSSYMPTDEPVESSGVRFLIEIPGYAEPLIYTVKERIIAAGEVTGVDVRKIGKTDYPYPVLRPTELHVVKGSEEFPQPVPMPLWYYPPPYDPYRPYYWPYHPYYPWRP